METHTQFSLRYDITLSILCALNLVCIRRPLTSKARVLSEVSPFEFWVDRGALGQGFLRVLRFVPVIVIPTVLRTILQGYQCPVITVISYPYIWYKSYQWFRVCCGYPKVPQVLRPANLS
jgi:hypothetical protein